MSEASIDSVIAEAVNAKVNAAVVEALSGDAVIGQYVANALGQQVELPGPSYGKKETAPFITVVIRNAMQAAVKREIEALLIAEEETVKDEIRKALRREIPSMAERFAKSLSDQAKNTYGVNVQVRLPGES